MHDADTPKDFHHHYHHHHRFNVYVSMLALAWQLPEIKPLHLTLSCAHFLFKPSRCTSPSTHSLHVFLPLPLRLSPGTSKTRKQTPNHLHTFAPDYQTISVYIYIYIPYIYIYVYITFLHYITYDQTISVYHASPHQSLSTLQDNYSTSCSVSCPSSLHCTFISPLVSPFSPASAYHPPPLAK